MKLLLDTVTFLWIISDSPQLTNRVREEFVNPDNEVCLSAVSTWEIVIKHSLGRLHLPEAPSKFIPIQREKHRISFLSLDEESTLHLALLPALHPDPFDRMLICQALVHGLLIATPDEHIVQYPVRVIW